MECIQHTIRHGFITGLITGLGSSVADLIYGFAGISGIRVFYFLSSFCAAIMNPASVLSFIAAFTMFGINGSLSFTESAGLLSGILAGTLCWWAALAGIVSILRDRVTGKIYKALNIILGSLMMVFGTAMVIKGATLVPVIALK